MPDQPNSPAAAPAAATLPNPALPPGLVFESAADRFARNHSGTMPPPPPGTFDPASGDQAAAALEQARAQDLQTARQRMGVQADPPAQPQDQQPADPAAQQAEPNLQLRPRAGKAKQVEQRRSADWDAMKQRTQQLEQELQRLRAGLPGQLNPDGSQASPQQQAAGLTPELVQQHELFKKLKEERDIFYEEIKHVRVEADPEFRAKFDSKREAAVRIAKGVSGQAASDIERILAITDPDIRASQLAERLTTGNFSEGTKQRILAANAQLSAIDVEREIEVATRKATWEHTQAARQQQQQQQLSKRMGQLDREFSDVVAEWNDPERGMPLMMARPEQAVAAARQIFSGETSGRELAKAALKAALFEDAVQLAYKASEEVSRLQESLRRYTGGSTVADYSGSGGYGGEPAAMPAGPVALSTLDRHFVGGLEAARRADLSKQQGW